MSQNCYCDLWNTNPDFLKNQGIPVNFCGLCDLCGAPGHTRHYPGPVPSTGSWCDECYRTQAYKGPDRDIGARYYNAASREEHLIADGRQLTFDQLAIWLQALVPPRSSLIIELPTERGIDFFVKEDGVIHTELSDRKHDLYGEGMLTLSEATQVLVATFEANDIRQHLERADVQLEYYEV